MNINRHNYEEYFILYADNELGSDERRMVDDFVFANPDLKDELDIYQNSILTADTSLKFDNKENLHRYDESILSYIDDELPTEEKTALEKLIDGSPSLQQELQLYRKTKLQPEAGIIFENKSVLYRSTEKRRVVPMQMMRWAAAAAILLAVSFTAVKYFTKSGIPDIAEANPDEKKTPIITKPTENIAIKKEEEKNETSIASDNSIEQAKQNSLALANVKSKKNLRKEIKPEIAIVPQEKKNNENIANNNIQQPPSNNLPAPQIKTNISETAIAIKEKEVPKNGVNIDIPSVTKQTGNPLVYAGGPTNLEPIDEEEESGKNKKSRGLFRKVTRFFEKNTGIKATDDDKLRIAAFTVKL